MDETQIKLADEDVSKAIVFVLVVSLVRFLGTAITFGLIVAGIIGLFNAVEHGAEVWNISLAILGAAIALRYIVSGAVDHKKSGKVES